MSSVLLECFVPSFPVVNIVMFIAPDRELMYCVWITFSSHCVLYFLPQRLPHSSVLVVHLMIRYRLMETMLDSRSQEARRGMQRRCQFQCRYQLQHCSLLQHLRHGSPLDLIVPVICRSENALAQGFEVALYQDASAHCSIGRGRTGGDGWGDRSCCHLLTRLSRLREECFLARSRMGVEVPNFPSLAPSPTSSRLLQ
jgi:hypothetical protein